MKTEQEQIEKMARTMCGYCSTDGKCAVSKNLREPDICTNVDTNNCLYKEHAEQLVENGFGDVSEYKAEIEQLEAKNKVLKDGIVKAFTNGFNEGRKQVEKDIRRAKIDTINTIIKYCETPNHWRELKDCKLWGGKSDDLRDFLNGIFKEVDV